MNRTTAYIVTGAAGLCAVAAAGLAYRATRRARVLRRLALQLATRPVPIPFDERMLTGLPDPASRFLRHAIAPGTPLASAVNLRMSGRMRPRPTSDAVDLEADEVLAPSRGFIWRAHLRMHGLPVRVVDFYDGEGVVSVDLFGILPLQTARGNDVSRSTRGRLAGEAVWIPSLLLPELGAAWEPVNADRARVTIRAAGEPISIELHVAGDGALREITMMRHGDVGVPGFQPLPYGFRVEGEATFEGYTIPSVVRGGWWYGTDRYDDEAAATFTIREATYR